ncbi:MAG: hypothetical protein EXS64_04835 [Candidatus Latescibacteria bacterium]|nr:hypothetical protein [Candidatus Latescibacterota bacterium]
MKTMYPDLDIDLTFQPVVCENPSRFTREQIDQYNAQGYITRVPLFEGEVLQRVQDFFRRSKKELTTYDMFTSLHHLNPDLHDIVVNQTLTEHLKDLLGPDIVCHVSQFICKEPGQMRVIPWHQDASFNPMDARCVIVWTAIDDATIDNGCMGFIPGSHRLGALDCNLEKGHEVSDADRNGEKVPIELRAGQAVFFSDLLLHSSPGNRTADRPRGGLTATYASAQLVPTLGHKKWAVLCSGQDPHNRWEVHPRPTIPTR